MIRKIVCFFWPVMVVANLTGQTILNPALQSKKLWYTDAFTLINAHQPKLQKPIVVAIIDDGFRLTHEAIKKFVYKNPKESIVNYIDDDGNGYIDDYSGWDVSDNDHDVCIPAGRENNYNHGTYIAGVITNLLAQTFGNNAAEYVKIMPVKALSDNTEDAYIKDGYKGIKYAINSGADIICCAWSGGILTPEEELILNQAKSKGIIILASAGNSFSEKALSPASHESVIAIAAVDSAYKKTPESNYGMFVDLSAPGRGVLGADVKTDSSYIYSSATSAAVATATACFATLKVLFPELTSQAFFKAVKNTAKPINGGKAKFNGKLGSGFIDINNSYQYLKQPEYAMTHFNPLLSEGIIDFNNKLDKTNYTIEIKPEGAFKGVQMNRSNLKGNAGKSIVSIYKNDTALFSKFMLSQLPEKLFVPGNSVRLDLNLKNASKNLSFEMEYEVQTVDSSTLFCSESRFFELSEGTIKDGSGNFNYTNLNDCKWIIKASKGKRIQINFDEMNTQPNVDYVYLFDGELAITENIIAKFSGSNIPPQVTSRSNTVLIWFVTDDQITGKGWQFKYKFVD